MITFTLELINIFILFRYVMGYEFRRARIPIAIGAVLILISCGLRIWFYEDVTPVIVYLLTILSITIPVCFFETRIFWGLSLSAFVKISSSLIETLFWGIEIIRAKGDIWDVNFAVVTLISQTSCIVVLILLSILLNSRREQTRQVMNKLHPLKIWPIICVLFICQFAAGYSGAVNHNTAQLMYGINLVRGGIIGVAVIIICILLLILRNQKRILKRQIILNEKCITEQSRQYRFMDGKDKELRKFHHDYNKHVAVLQALMEKKNIEGLEKYIGELGVIKAGLDFVSTNNVICDAIVNQYCELCRKKDISLEVTGKLPVNLRISEVDLCVILSNGLENAFEAVQKRKDHREIIFTIKSHGNMIIIEITNPTAERPAIKNGFVETTKPDREHHGYGTKNMSEAAERSGGSIIWEYDERGILSTRITLLCEEE